MIRTVAIAALAAGMLGCLPAHAQQGAPELEGAPGWRTATKPNPAPAKPAPQVVQKQSPAETDRLKADQAKLAQQAEAQRIDQARITQQAADLKAQQARLDARAAELAAEEKRIEQLRIDRESAQPKLAERDDIVRDDPDIADADEADTPDEAPRGAQPDSRRRVYARFDFEDARRSCARAGRNAALARDFYSARYETAPRLYQSDGWELRGSMRLEDRRGYVLVDAVCELDSDGEVWRFAFLR